MILFITVAIIGAIAAGLAFKEGIYSAALLSLSIFCYYTFKVVSML